jgi:DNA-binding transcriptional regulator/RsmH inhibitor MraZ
MASILKVDTIQAPNGTTAATIDTSGRIFTPARPAFSVHGNASTWFSLTTANTWQTITGFDTERYDIGSNYNTSTAEFTVPVDGIYMLTLRGWLEGSADSANYLRIAKDGVSLVEGGENGNNNDDHTIQLTTIVQLDSGDVIVPQAYRSVIHATNDVYLGINYSEFSGFLVG